MLRAGGTATDAALAVLLALNVVEPQSSGIGGGGFLLLDDGKGRITSYDGRETAPAAATPQWFEAEGKTLGYRDVVPGGLSVGVPGNVAMMAMVHRRHGKLAWKRLFAPAIALARDGFELTPRLHQFLTTSNRTASHDPAALALYHDAASQPLPVGTVIRNPAFADLLERIAKRGPRAFYRGEQARRIASAVSQAAIRPAPLTAADLAAYRPKQREPLCGTYRGNRICSMGPPSSGATSVLSMLAMLERFDMAALGKDSVTAWHLFAEVQRLAFADRDRWLADADFVPVPVAGLLAPEYLAARAQLIAPDRAMASVSAGTPPGAVLAFTDAPSGEVPSTSHFAVIDRKGRAASLTSTIEGPFGSGIVVDGMFLNNELTDFSLNPERDGQLVANRVEPGKRPLSSMSPALVHAPDGKLRMAVGAAGGRAIPVQVTKAIIGVIDWGLSAQEAI
ncbi:MAG TPA: gamma-glutamyltransferase, partial [Novosphingobium sp.]|nr:gamma-glutamyltransferase [Novosphingobium sp.]